MKSFAALMVMGICIILISGEITGTVKVIDRGGKPVDLKKDEVIVLLEGVSRPIPEELRDTPYIMRTKNKEFSPRILVVPKGARVRFPNFDPIIHNVFSVSGGNRFDAGRYSKGQGKSKAFLFPGLVRVYCNVHHQMNALIYVSDNPNFAYVAPDGRFQLKNAPNGTYNVQIVHQVGGARTKPVTVTANQSVTVDFEIELRGSGKVRHLNKDGKPYKRRRSRKY